MRANGINRGTLSYHLGQLAALGPVHEVRVRGMTRYFMQGCARSALEENLLIHRNNSMRSRILDMLDQAPAVTRTDLKKGLGISGPALVVHMQLLVRDGIVCEIQAPKQIGRPVRYALTGGAREILEKMKGTPEALTGPACSPESQQGQGSLSGQ